MGRSFVSKQVFVTAIVLITAIAGSPALAQQKDPAKDAIDPAHVRELLQQATQ
jgi:hypothetical protein